MIEISRNWSNGFSPVVETDKWKLVFVTYTEMYGPPQCLKRHLDTDEVFVLIRGHAILYSFGDEKVSSLEMEPNLAYNIKKGTWHHLSISQDAFLIAVENRDISKEHTERMDMNGNS